MAEDIIDRILKSKTPQEAMPHYGPLLPPKSKDALTFLTDSAKAPPAIVEDLFPKKENLIKKPKKRTRRKKTHQKPWTQAKMIIEGKFV